MKLAAIMMTSVGLGGAALPAYGSGTEGALAKEAKKDNPRARYVLSARGPGSGELAFGATVSFPKLLETRLAFGLTESLVVDVGFAGPLIYRASAGPRLRLFSTDRFALAVRAALDAVGTDLDRSGAIGLETGILASVGGETFDFTLEASTPFLFAASGVRFNDLSDRFQSFELSFGIESAAVTAANVLFEVGVIAVQGGHKLEILPLVAVGGTI